MSGRCDAYSTDASALATFRFSQGPKAQELVLLPEIISKEPLGVMVRKGDDKWFDLVRWTFIAMITAEEKGITSKNVDSFMTSTDPDIRRLLGLEGDMGKALGGRQQMGLQRHQAGRQSWRGVGPQHHPDGCAARHQQHLDQGRPAIRPADPLSTRPDHSTEGRPGWVPGDLLFVSSTWQVDLVRLIAAQSHRNRCTHDAARCGTTTRGHSRPCPEQPPIRA